jgi:hypothetical protein
MPVEEAQMILFLPVIPPVYSNRVPMRMIESAHSVTRFRADKERLF